MRFDLQDGFPAVTTKRVHWPSVIHELLWFISGETNIAYLQENKVRIWNEWADENGDLGPVYGKAMEKMGSFRWQDIGSASSAVDMIRKSPESRRIIVSAWNVGELDEMALDALSCSFPILCCRREVVLSALSEECGCFPRCTFQYLFICSSHVHDGSGV